MKSVNIATLKAQLSAVLAQVRKGARVTILDRKTPIATLIPHLDPPSLNLVTEPQHPFEPPRSVALNKFFDVAKLLREDRDRR